MPSSKVKLKSKKRSPGKIGRGGPRPLYLIISISPADRRHIRASARKAKAPNVSAYVRRKLGCK